MAPSVLPHIHGERMRTRRPRTPIQQITDPIRLEWASYLRKHAAIQKQSERVLQDDGRRKTLIRCEHCQQLFPREEIEANHKNPVGPLLSTKPDDIAAYRARMFCRVAEIEALCRLCHQAHTRQCRAELRERQRCKQLNANASPSTLRSGRPTAPLSASASL